MGIVCGEKEEAIPDNRGRVVFVRELSLFMVRNLGNRSVAKERSKDCEGAISDLTRAIVLDPKTVITRFLKTVTSGLKPRRHLK